MSAPVRRPRDLFARYFTPHFVLDAGNQPGADQYVAMHSNRVLMVGLAPTHPVVVAASSADAAEREALRVVRVDFDTVAEETDEDEAASSRKRTDEPSAKRQRQRTDAVTDGMNLRHVRVSGKGKIGAPKCRRTTPLCRLTCANDKQFWVVAGFPGRVVEVNPLLADHPEWIAERVRCIPVEEHPVDGGKETANRFPFCSAGY